MAAGYSLLASGIFSDRQPAASSQKPEANDDFNN
jgi:hypothetical protein